ncbi:MAG: bifunctional glutamate N-acetyltransferase/amino-acid acetyltransferase ArgJ [Acidobacteria bacterium]|nr:bifunctional glutamate N-acetyltransferase/amino-acid acetyltransferase ArgJ [Acidobacteriota bacterium]
MAGPTPAHVAIDRIPGGVTTPLGFRTAAIACGIKASGLDLALLVADAPASAAALFTTNLVKAAPVLLSQQHLRSSRGVARAIVVNSGCANACTGEQGLAVAQASAAEAARLLECRSQEVLVASTGVIGVALDIEKLRRGLARLVPELRDDRHHDAALAIMTTDRGPKECAVRVTLPGGTFLVGGMAKGAGMIAPNMATMLAFVTTDVRVPSSVLREALTDAARTTFNAITVDGDTSTNDTLFVLASGASGQEVREVGDPTYPLFLEGLREVCRALALEIVRGAEGATKVVSLEVSGAPSDEDARTVARVVANSPLVKTAVHGGDPNWGRLLAAMGRAGVPFDPDRSRVAIGHVVMFDRGVPFDDRAQEAAAHLAGAEISVQLDLGGPGSGRATLYTCDLSAEYVRINADYRT